jgi:hypothetical protein
MQPHNSDDQRATQGDSDRGRDTERYPSIDAALMAISQAFDLADGKVRVAQPGQPLNLFASLKGSGGVDA